MSLTWGEYQTWLNPATKIDTYILEKPAPLMSDWTTDSRTIKPGDWFIPLIGESFDGHRYISEALQKGAAGFLFSLQTELVDPKIQTLGIAVADTLLAFQRMALGWRKHQKSLKLISLTGSNGKTTTKEMVLAALQISGKTLATEGNYNNEIGVPKTLQRLLPDDRFAVVEFGARKPGNIRELCSITEPDVVALLNVGLAHVGIFGSPQALLQTKLEIFNSSPQSAVQIAFYDDQDILAGARKTGKSTITFGKNPNADVCITRTSIDSQKDRLVVFLSYQGQTYEVCLHTAHEIFAVNCAAAFAIGIASGCTPDSLVKGLTGFTGVKGRYRVHKTKDLIIVDDSYNSNPGSMKAGLDSLAASYQNQQKILILGDMLELGSLALEEHLSLGRYAIQKARPQFVIAVGSHAHDIAKGALDTGFSPKQVMIYPDVDTLINALNLKEISLKNLGNLVYVKGSHGIRLDRAIDLMLGVIPPKSP